MALDPERLRNYKHHQETILYNRVNIAYVVWAILAAAFFAAQSPIPRYVISISGFLVTILLSLAILRQRKVVSGISELLLKCDCSYQEIRKSRVKAPFWFSGQIIMFYLLPGIITVFWLALILLKILGLVDNS